MKTLLVAATALEVPEFLDGMKPEEVMGGAFRKHLPGFEEVDLLITGPGIPATLFFLTRHFEQHSYDWVINAGIAGSFKEAFPLGTPVHVVRDGFSELGAMHPKGFIPFYEMEMTAPFRPDFMDPKGWIQNDSYPKISALTDLPAVTGVTVNEISNDPERIRFNRDRFNATVESMEGAAFFWCCRMMGIKCTQVRTISNLIVPNHLATWDIPLAVETLQDIIKKIIYECR